MTDLPPEPPLFGLDWRHVKTGHVYSVVGTGLIEATLTPCVVYEGGGRLWVRPYDEFMDGRFVCVDHEAP